MFPLAGLTAGLNGLKFFEETHEYSGGNIGEPNSKNCIFLKTEFVFKNRIFFQIFIFNSTGNVGLLT